MSKDTQVEILISAKMFEDIKSAADELGLSISSLIAGVLYSRANVARQKASKILAIADSWDSAAKTVAAAPNPLKISIVNAGESRAAKASSAPDDTFVVSLLG